MNNDWFKSCLSVKIESKDTRKEYVHVPEMKGRPFLLQIYESEYSLLKIKEIQLMTTPKNLLKKCRQAHTELRTYRETHVDFGIVF